MDSIEVPILFVAPYTGAWIEMIKCLNGKVAVFVAPYTGAWIEITKDRDG